MLDICTNVTGFSNADMATLRFCLHSTDPNNSHPFDPFNNLRVTLPKYFLHHVDSFRGEPAHMIRIIANVPFRSVDWNTTEGVLRFETERDMGGMTTIKFKSVIIIIIISKALTTRTIY